MSTGVHCLLNLSKKLKNESQLSEPFLCMGEGIKEVRN